MTDEELNSWEANAKKFVDRSTHDGMVYMSENDQRILSLIAEVRRLEKSNSKLRDMFNDLGDAHALLKRNIGMT